MDAHVSRLRFIPFEVPTPVNEPPEGDDWIHEVKFDGYRTELVIDNGNVTALSRRGSTGVTVILASSQSQESPGKVGHSRWRGGDHGQGWRLGLFRPDQGRAQENPKPSPLVAFDILHMDGIDLCKEPLIRQRALVRELIPDDGPIQFSDHFVASGKKIFEAVKKLELEGIVSQSGRKRLTGQARRATGLRPRTTPKSNCRSSVSCRRPASRP